jgi:two-component system sensor histidine kinase and response regulator WspE
MGLAGESLVEARRVEPLVTSMRRLSKQQQALTDLVDELAASAPTSELAQRAKLAARDLRTQLLGRTGELEGHARRAEDLTRRLYGQAIASRMRPFSDGVRGFPRLVRDLARTLDQSVDLVIAGEEVDVDRDILERIEAPINHMLRNANDHGIETSAERRAAGKPERATLRLEARHWAGMLTVRVSDDGRGIDPGKVRRKIVERGLVAEHTAAELSDVEVLDWLFRPGFSTADEVSLVSGRGVGLDVVRSVLQEIGGTVRLGSEPGKGTSFHLQLPITLSVQRAVVVEIAGEPYAFPLLRIERLHTVEAAQVHTLEGRPFFTLEGKNVALVAAAQVLELGAVPPRDTLSVVVIGERLAPVGVIVDRFLGEQDLVVRPLDRRLGKVADLSAAAILPDGTPLLILDVDDMCRSIIRLLQGGALGAVAAAEGGATARVGKRVLVVDDSISVRELERQVLANRGYEVAIAVDGMDAWETLRAGEFDLVITDVDMPRMNGIELTRSIKQDPRLRAIPVMIVSYRENQADRLRGLDAGANYYLTKSNFHDETLVQAVGDLIGAAS